nr:hypothetical protein [Verrucomicrobium sp. 3C]
MAIEPARDRPARDHKANSLHREAGHLRKAESDQLSLQIHDRRSAIPLVHCGIHLQ